MADAFWIWYPGDYEIYHNMLLHCRRESFGYDYPSMWHICRPEVTCSFSHPRFHVPRDTVLRAVTRGSGFVRLNGSLHPTNADLPLKAGDYDIRVRVQCIETFPSLFIDNEYLKTGEDWTAECMDGICRPAGWDPAFTEASQDPAVFPFSYRLLTPASVTPVDGGMLWDFGCETYGHVTVSRDEDAGAVLLSYGESKEEALDYKEAYISQSLPAGKGEMTLPPRAFRYLFVRAEGDSSALSLSAKEEYLPIEDKASFVSDDERLNAIFGICTRTFHLNSREGYLDGIKRDRWIWSGDAYQSFLVNRYLYREPGIVRRTIRALLGKPPYFQHINTINDYSLYLLIAIWEYYYDTGDLAFVRQIDDTRRALYEFVVSRLDETTGYMVKRSGDWIFIDWANLDKNGPLSSEQILLWEMYRAMGRLEDALGGDGTPYLTKADALRVSILRDFWDEEKKAFIDSAVSGNRHVSRHPNILAILFDFVSPEQKAVITESVLHSDLAEPITTPYFKFFELMALAKQGDIKAVQEYISSYWGGMLDLGATTFWEQYDPRKHGIEHYGMYSYKYDCSLCHAWGSGPIALLGRYVVGVRPTSVAWKTFAVEPMVGSYQRFDAVVPVEGGSVTAHYDHGTISVRTDVEGGTLRFGGKTVPLPKNETVVLTER